MSIYRDSEDTPVESAWDTWDRESRYNAGEIFYRVMSEGTEKFGLDWLKFHGIASDCLYASYLHPFGGQDIDIRFKALMAEFGNALLSKYQLVKREDSNV